MKLEFKKGAWENSGLLYAYSTRFSPTPKFIQEVDHIRNRRAGEAKYDFDFITLLHPDRQTKCADIKAVCSFDSYGAPLLVMVKDMKKDDNGDFRYSDYFEVVLYENGINVWRLYDTCEGVKWEKIMAEEFLVTEKEKHTLSVRIEDKTIIINTDGREMSLKDERLYESFFIGFTACEGLNRLYSLEINE